MIDFIGQEGPTSKLKLVALDTCVLMLQIVMVSVHVKRRELKKRSANAQQVASEPRAVDESQANPGQDADAEERGVLRRSDSIASDADSRLNEEDSLLNTTVDEMSGRDTDLLDALASGQVVIADLDPISALRQEHANYQAHRQSLSESGGAASSFSPTTLRQLNTMRMRFGVGGG